MARRSIRHKEHRVGEHQLFVKSLIPHRLAFGHPLVLVHGAFSGYLVWHKMGRRLAEYGFGSHALSLRGHDPNPHEVLSGTTLDDYVDDLHATTASLKLKHPVVIGHSMGGLVALQYAARFSASALILLDPALPSEIWTPEIDQALIQNTPEVVQHTEVGVEGESAILRLLQQVPPDIHGVDLVTAWGFLDYPESKRALLDIVQGVSVPTDAITDIPKLVFGATVGGGLLPVDIPLVKVQEFAETYHGDFVPVTGATHAGIVMGEHADEVTDLIMEWLREL